MALARLIYVSEPDFDPSRGSAIAQLSQIMSSSQRQNQAADVTGALIYDESCFLQVLEGERRAIWTTFLRISEDERHTDCQLIEMVEIDRRLFGNWWMGLATLDEASATSFAPYLVGGALRADRMSASDILGLMAALAKLGLRREMRVPAT